MSTSSVNHNVATFVSKDIVREQAALWISRIDRGLSDDEKAQLVDWVKLSRVHQKDLLELAELWDDLSVLNELSHLFPVGEDMSKQRRVFGFRARRAIAASAAFLFISVTSWLLSDLHHPNAEQINYTTQYLKTRIGEQKNLTLSDGSVVHLNTNSAVEVNYASKQRNITLLQGEAHFEVAHDNTRPFIVTAGNTSVTAVGTAFNMQLATDDSLELLVTEGKVLVAKSDASVPETDLPVQSEPLEANGRLMLAGDKARIGDNLYASKQHLDGKQIEREMAWIQGMLVFQGEALESALKEIARYTPIEFEISDQAVREQLVAGYFKAGDIDGLLFTLKSNFNIQHKRPTPNRIVLYSQDVSAL